MRRSQQCRRPAAFTPASSITSQDVWQKLLQHDPLFLNSIQNLQSCLQKKYVHRGASKDAIPRPQKAYCGRRIRAQSRLHGRLDQIERRVGNAETAEVVGQLSQMCEMEQLHEAVEAVELWCNRGLLVSQDIIHCLLKECAKKKDLDAVRRVHSLIVKAHLESVSMLGDQLIRLFALCGSLQDANQVFGKVREPSVYTWHAIISAHAMLGQSYNALQLFYYMQYQGNIPNKFIFSCILKVCGIIVALGQGKLLHHAIISIRLEPDVVIGTALVDMYAKCGSIEEAYSVFDKQLNRNVVSWGAMIAGCAQHGRGFMALQLFENMQKQGLKPDRVTFLCVLKACGHIGGISQGKLIHAMIIESRLDFEMAIRNSLVDMYAKGGSFDDALDVFNKLVSKDVVSWGAMIAGYAQHGRGIAAFQLFEGMQLEGVKPNKVILLCVLKACGSTMDLSQVQRIHDMIIRSGFELDQAVGNTLVDMYAKCGTLEEARLVFDALKNRDAVSWGAMMTGYVQHGLTLPALSLFVKMEEVGIKPDRFTFSCVLKACGGIGAIQEGRILHEQILKGGLDSDTVVANALLDMYVKCRSLEEAGRVFDKLSNRDLVSWAAMIGGYADHGRSADALELFYSQQKGMTPSKVSFLSALKACSSLESVRQGKLIHDQIIRTGLESDTIIGNTLIDTYSKCGGLEEARKAFDQSWDRSVVSWGAMIAGYAQHGHGFAALQLFEKMQQEGVEPNRIIFLSSLKACGSIGAVGPGKVIHEQVIKCGLASDVGIGNTLLDMYAKCGSLEEARKVFKGLPTRSEVTWAAMIVAHANHGESRLVQQFLDDMQHEGLKPNGTIFTSILMACCHAGQVEEGRRYFKSMLEDHGIIPSIEHFTCMIDLLGRAGRLEEAKQFLQSIPFPSDIAGWMSLLTACRIYSNVDLGKQCFDELVKLDPEYTAGYLLMLKIFADASLWDDVHRLEEVLSSVTASKKPGKAWIEVDNSVQEFFAGDQTHPSSESLYSKLRFFRRLMKGEGYVAHMDGVLERLQESPHEETFGEQFERVSLGLGLPITNESTTVQAPATIQLHNSFQNDVRFETQNEILNNYHQNLQISLCSL